MNSNLTKSNTNIYKQILLKKLSYAVTSILLVHLFTLILYIQFVNLSISNPLNPIFQVIPTLTRISTWIYILLLSSAIFALSILCAKDFVTEKTNCTNRYEKIKLALSPHKVIQLFTHIGVGYIHVWTFLSITNGKHSDLIEECDKSYCLNESAFALLTAGIWSGYFYYITIYKTDKRILFPTVQQPKRLQFKLEVFNLLKASCKSTIKTIIIFIVFYEFCGNYLCNSFANSFSFKMIQKTLDVELIANEICFATLITFTFNLITYFFELFLTESMEFLIAPPNNENITLSEALVADIPIIQHLACQDLFILAGNSMERRSILFSLSQPGGHPHNWNAIMEAALKIIQNYTETLNKSLNNILMNEQIKPKNFVEPVASTPKLNYDKLRNMSMHTEHFTVINSSNVNISNINRIDDEMKNRLNEFIDRIIAKLKQRLGINYLFEELPEMNIEKCLKNGQVIMWLTQALSALYVASLKEDRFGVAQKDLAVVITTFVDLKIAVEKLNRLPNFNKKSSGNENFNTKMKCAVLSAIKRSLFNLCAHFEPYLATVNLKKDAKLQIAGLLQCKPNYY